MIPGPPLQREHDSYIMDHVLNSNHYTPAEVRRLNYCRLYLNAVTVSDLANPDGMTLDLAFLEGRISTRRSLLAKYGVHQERPSKNEWRLWRRANLLWGTIDGRLRQPLGKWIHILLDCRRHYFAYQFEHRVWIRALDNPTMYSEYSAHRCLISAIANAMSLSANSPIKHDRSKSTTIRMTGVGPSAIPATHSFHHLPPTGQPDTFDAYVQTMKAWERELLQLVDLRMEPYEFCVELQPYFKAGCDGSVRPISQHSAFGWSIRAERGTTAAQGMGPAPGSKPTSNRAEAYGMLSIMRFFIRIAEYTDMHRSWRGTIGTDSQSLLDTLSGKDVDPQAEDTPVSLHGSKVVLDVLCPEWDILIEIQKSMEQLPNVNLEYVQGHQDRDKPYHTLYTMSQLIVDADRKAAQFQDEHGAYRGIVPLTPGGSVRLLGPHGTITTLDYVKKLRYTAVEAPLRLYMLKKYEWCPDIYNSVNWEAHGVALQKLNLRRIHYTNLVHDILPTTHMAKKSTKDNANARSANAMSKPAITYFDAQHHHPRQPGAQSFNLPSSRSFRKITRHPHSPN